MIAVGENIFETEIQVGTLQGGCRQNQTGTLQNPIGPMIDAIAVIANPYPAFPVVAYRLYGSSFSPSEHIEDLAFYAVQSAAAGPYPQTTLTIGAERKDEVVRQTLHAYSFSGHVQPVDSITIGSHDEVSLRILARSDRRHGRRPGIFPVHFELSVSPTLDTTIGEPPNSSVLGRQ